MFKSTTSDALDALIEQYGVSKDARAMIKSFLDLKPEQQEAVVAYVKKVAAALNEEDPASPSLSLLPPIDPQSKPEAVEPEPDYKAEARAEAEKYYQMLLLEKRMESQGPSASEFGAG